MHTCACTLASIYFVAQVNARDRAGMTPLGWACLKGHLELARLLLEARADPLLKAHTGVLVGKSAITLARLHGSQVSSDLDMPRGQTKAAKLPSR